MIPENPFFPLLIGGGFCLATLGLWYAFRHWLPLALCGVAMAITAAIVLLSFLVETPREQVERTIHRLAMAVQQNDIDRVLSLVVADDVRMRDAAKREMGDHHFVMCWVTKVQEIQLDESAAPSQAHALVNVVAQVDQSRHYDAGRGAVKLWLDLRKDSDGQWRVSGYRYSVNDNPSAGAPIK
jgi:ketosteroid isomerase-like protein